MGDWCDECDGDVAEWILEGTTYQICYSCVKKQTEGRWFHYKTGEEYK